jgi:nucleotide-binding universal stress UspA family protein
VGVAEAGAAAPSVGRSGRIVLIDRPDTPEITWLDDWCRAARWQVSRRSAPAEANLEGGPVIGGCGQLAAEVARLNSTGCSVLVHRRAAHSPTGRRVIAAVYDLPEDEAILLHAAGCAGAVGGALLLVHAVPLSFAERSVGLEEALERGSAVLDAGLAMLIGKEPDLRVETRLVREHPHEFVGSDLAGDLLVVGGARVGRGSPLGLVARSAIQHAGCPVLVVAR